MTIAALDYSADPVGANALAHAFAAANGWELGEPMPVPERTVLGFPAWMFDEHTLYFRRKGRPIAVAVQTRRNPAFVLAAIARSIGGLIVRVPPLARQSFADPGNAYFVCVTQRGHPIRWLSHQQERPARVGASR